MQVLIDILSVILILGTLVIMSYLVTTGHPWFGLAVLIVCCSYSYKEDLIQNKDKERGDRNV